VRENEGLLISIFVKETVENFNADNEVVKNIHHSMVNNNFTMNNLFINQPISAC
jgi:hypothetical protein